LVVAPLPDVLALQVADPIKVIEYGAMAKPMVLDPVGDLPRALIHQRAAIAPIDKTPRSFASAIRYLASDVRLQERLADSAQRVCKPLTWERSGSLLAQQYAAIVT